MHWKKSASAWEREMHRLGEKKCISLWEEVVRVHQIGKKMHQFGEE